MRWLSRLPLPGRHQEPTQPEQNGPQLADPPWLDWLVADVEGRLRYSRPASAIRAGTPAGKQARDGRGTGAEATETPLQAFLDSLFNRDDVPAEALHGRGDAEATWERWVAGEPPRSSSEAWLYAQFWRGPEQEHGAELGRSQSKADREAEAGA